MEYGRKKQTTIHDSRSKLTVCDFGAGAPMPPPCWLVGWSIVATGGMVITAKNEIDGRRIGRNKRKAKRLVGESTKRWCAAVLVVVVGLCTSKSTVQYGLLDWMGRQGKVHAHRQLIAGHACVLRFLD